MSEAVVTPTLSRKRRFSEENQTTACSVINHVMRTKVVFHWMPGIAWVKTLSKAKVKIRYGSRLWVPYLSLNSNYISKGLPTA